MIPGTDIFLDRNLGPEKTTVPECEIDLRVVVVTWLDRRGATC